MKNRLTTYIAVLLVLFPFFIFTSTLVSAQVEQDNATKFSQLQKDISNFIGHTNPQTGTPDFLFGEPLFRSINGSDNFTETISHFFNEYPDLFQVPLSDFTLQVEHPKNRTITQVHLFQKYQTVPVFGSEMILTFNQDNDLIAVLGHNTPGLSLNVKPIISKELAQQVVAHDLHLDKVTEQPVLQIFNKGTLTNTVEQNKLVWHLATNDKVYFIDAETHEIVYSYIDESNALSRFVYSAEGGTPTLPGSLVISEGDNISSITDEDARHAYEYSEDVYNYYHNHFSLDSFDDAGSPMVTTVDYSLDPPNSGWCNPNKPTHTGCPTTPQTIFSDGYTVLDIVGHEWTHAIDDYAIHEDGTTNYGLTMSDEPGALNESYSDIFGVLIEAEYGDGLDWDMGEDLPTGVGRNLADPTLYSQPDNMSGYVDGGDVHTNSGIPNKAAYLIMSDLGLEKAENIFYYTLRDQLTASATFEDNYNALLATCLTLDVASITQTDCVSIYNAYTTIGVADSTYLYADVQATPTSGYAPLSVDFDGAASFSLGSTIRDYVWDLDSTIDSDGDGSATNDSDNTGPIASYTYSSTGAFQARLTVTDATGNFTHTTTTITVQNSLAPAFNITGDHTTTPATVSFDASASTGSITDYSWNFGDGATASSGTVATTTHAYSNPGSYPVTLTTTYSNGSTQTITLTALIYATGTIGSNTTWRLDHSPYVISGNLTIAARKRLTIEPGVVVKFLMPQVL